MQGTLDYDYANIPQKDLFQIGAIVSTHGLRGDMRVFPTTDDPRRYKKGMEILLDTGRGLVRTKAETVRFHKQFVILKLEGYDSIEAVTPLRKKSLYVTRENAVKLKKDEYFIADLIGLSVIDEDDAGLGTIKDVIITGANDVYVVEREAGGEVLIPAIKQCILSVDMESRTMRVHLLPGLLDEGSDKDSGSDRSAKNANADTAQDRGENV